MNIQFFIGLLLGLTLLFSLIIGYNLGKKKVHLLITWTLLLTLIPVPGYIILTYPFDLPLNMKIFLFLLSILGQLIPTSFAWWIGKRQT